MLHFSIHSCCDSFKKLKLLLKALLLNVFSIPATLSFHYSCVALLITVSCFLCYRRASKDSDGDSFNGDSSCDRSSDCEPIAVESPLLWTEDELSYMNVSPTKVVYCPLFCFCFFTCFALFNKIVCGHMRLMGTPFFFFLIVNYFILI